jgi:SAM-dependent methyltransferase
MTSAGYLGYQRQRIDHWDGIARRADSWPGLGRYYHRRTADIYSLLVPAGSRVLEIGCGEGGLLARLKPSYGVGVDFSLGNLSRARAQHPELHFIGGDAHALPIRGTFDFIILSDVVNDLWDVQSAFEAVRAVCHARTRVILNFYNAIWELPLRLAQKVRLARPNLDQNWLAHHDVDNLLRLAGFESVRSWKEILLPLPIPLVSSFVNRWLAKIWPLSKLDLTTFLIARVEPAPAEEQPSVTIVVPARNEAGNIEKIFETTPEFGSRTELIFVEGHSSDDTYAAIERAIEKYPTRGARLFRQTGRGKGDAVRLGFEKATGDILMILDADMTVPPGDLPRFYEAVRTRRGEFINGVRLVYPMEKQAMRLANLAGNRFFSSAFSWIIGQPIKDTLCGTKVLWRDDYQRIAANRAYFGDFDPFGDFDLLFGAVRLHLKILDLPIRYRDRTYGETNIQRWRHGLLLLRMVIYAARRLKFV